MSQHAKFNRQNLTRAESRLWYYLRNRRLNGYKFVRQMALGPYIADFVCREKKLVLEVDGGQHGMEDGKAYDQRRAVFLEQCGYRVVRVWNFEVMQDVRRVLEWVLMIIEEQD